LEALEAGVPELEAPSQTSYATSARMPELCDWYVQDQLVGAEEIDDNLIPLAELCSTFA
jgi:hypothetical protein